MCDGEMPEFDPDGGISANAETLYALLGLIPNRFAGRYRSVLFGSGPVFYVKDWNIELVLFLHFLSEVGNRPGFGRASKKKLLHAYCGKKLCAEGAEDKLAKCVQRLFRNTNMFYRLYPSG